MKNIEQILSEAGVQVDPAVMGTINKAVLDNYRTIADYDGLKSKRDELQTTLNTVTGELEKFKDVNVDDLKSQIAALNNTIETERGERARAEERAKVKARVDEFLGATDQNGKRLRVFVNDITENAIRAEVLKALESDTSKGVSMDDIFKAVTTDENGNVKQGIFAEARKVTKFTSSMGKDVPNDKDAFKNMTLEEKMELKRNDPELYRAMRNSR
jgi:hypothetical protein